MKKITKLKICDWALLILTIAILTSGIQLEASHSSGLVSVWIHIAIGLLFAYLVSYHIYLHFGFCNWFIRFRKQRSQLTRILWWVSLITLITGLITSVHWLMTFNHAPVGGVHGKLGFLMILLSMGHIIKRFRFFKRK